MGDLITWLLEHINYWTVTLFMAIESSFIPFPSEVVVPPAAYKAMGGELNIFLVVIAATIGADIGALVNYSIARWLGRPFVYKFANSRLGKLCLIDEKKIQRAEMFFEDYGAISTLTGRLLPVVRQFISIPAGISRMKLGPFLLYTTIGAGIWNIVLAIIGCALHRIVPYEELPGKVYEYSHLIGYSIVGIVAVACMFLFIRHRLKKRQAAD